MWLKTVTKAFVTSQFGYCLLIWMIHRRGLNNKINSLSEKALRITYSDKSSSFQELERKDNLVSIHHMNLQALATEFFKVEYIVGSEIMKDHF